MSIKFRRPISYSLLFALLYCFFAYPLFLSEKASAKAVLYDGRDGLNSNDISAIVKDNRGLIWLGTANGLNLFDGYTFSKFEGALSNKPIYYLKLNPATNELSVVTGTGTGTGLFVIDLNTLVEKQVNIKKYIGLNTNAPTVKIESICYNNYDKTVYYACRNGIFKVGAKAAFIQLCTLNNINTKKIGILPYDKDHLLINGGTMSILDIKTGQCVPVDMFKNLKSISKARRAGDTLLVYDSNSNAYATNIRYLQNNTITSTPFFKGKLPLKPVKSFLRANKFYCLSENYDFFVYDLKSGKVDSLSKKYPDIFEGKVFYSIFVDENDIIWIGTNKGLIKIAEHSAAFSTILHNLPQRISTRKIFEDGNGDLYVCSYAGLMHFSKETQQWTQYLANSKNMTASISTHLYNENVFPQCILPYSSDALYIGYDSPQLLIFNKKTKNYESLNIRYKDQRDELTSIFDLAEDKNGVLWMGGYNGLATYNRKANLVSHRSTDIFAIGNSRLRILLNDTINNLMYVGASNGFFIFDINKGLIKHFSTASVPALNNNDILFVGKDKKNNLWLGTNGGGVNIISADLKSIRYIRKQDGLSSEIVYSMIPENDNVFWFGTFNGLDRYQLDRNSFTNFFEEDGISSNEFNQNSFLKTRDGKFYFGGINGITTFYPQQFVQLAPFNIYFAGISKWDNKAQNIHLYYRDLPPGSTITKSPSDQLIELHFGCTDYSDPQRNAFSYRIKEISSNWISLDDHHSLSIGGLPYGRFTLEIKAINGRGATSANTLIYYLKITQPIYKTWWFFALLLLFIVMAFYAAYLIKSHNFKKVLHLRMKIASNLHDEVGSLLTRITMFSDNLRYSKNNEEQRNIKLEKIAVLSRNAVASMSDVLWTIDSRNDFAGNMLDRMREQAEEMLFPLGIDVNFVLEVDDLKKHIDSDTRGEVYLVFKEAINNIVKHSNASEVEITYKLTDKYFYLKIANNGIVESISDISTGQGLNNMKMRAKKIGAQIKIECKDNIFLVELEN